MRALLWMAAAILPAACATFEAEAPYVPPTEGLFTVEADFETPLVDSRGDSADDPAIYIDAAGKGFIAGTDKQAGLYIYNLDGTQREFMPLGPVNNVDVRTGFPTQGGTRVLLVNSDDENKTVVPVLYHTGTDTFEAKSPISVKPSPYGICLGKVAGGFHVGVTTKAGIFYQYEIAAKAGDLSLTPVREFSTGTKTEGCVFDDRTAKLYIAEEEGGLYAYEAAPSAGDAQTVIARPGEHGLMADLEGVTVYPQGSNAGYLLVSSQGNNTYAAFSLPDYAFAGQFEIGEGATDRTSVTDGIDVIATPSPQFPEGFFVAQDNDNATPPSAEGQEVQNFKIVDWRKIKDGLNR